MSILLGKNIKFYKFSLYCIAFFVSIILFLTFPASTINAQINYQGRLANSSGGLLGNGGTYKLLFCIYTSASGGTNCTSSGTTVTLNSAIYGEVYSAIAPSNGVFNIQLGSGGNGYKGTFPTLGTAPVIAQDNFSRGNQTYWGTASDGQTWSGDAATNAGYTINGNTGQVTNVPSSSDAILGGSVANAEVLFSGSLNTAVSNNMGTVLRWQDTNNWYKAYIDGWNSLFVIQRSIAGTKVVLTSTAFSFTSGVNYSVRFRADGTNLYAKVWQTSNPEPSSWTLTTTDSTFSSGYSGLRIQMSSGQNANITSFNETVIDPVPQNTNYYVGITVNTDSEMTPRQQLIAAAYSQNTGLLEGFAASQTPIGGQIPVLDSNGYLNLSGNNPQINASSSNTLTLQGSGQTGNIQFFNSNNYISSVGNIALTGSNNILSGAPVATANYGILSIGNGGFAGGGGYNFAGNVNGTAIAINAASGFTTNAIEYSMGSLGSYAQISDWGNFDSWNSYGTYFTDPSNFNSTDGTLMLGYTGTNTFWCTGGVCFNGSPNGTLIAADVNSSFTGNLIDLQTYGTTAFKLDSNGNMTATNAITQNYALTTNTVNTINMTYPATAANGLTMNQNVTYTASANNSGNLINLSRSLTASGAGTVLTDSGTLMYVSNNCTIASSGTCTDTAPLLSLYQNNLSATGQVVHIEDKGFGTALDAEQDPTFTTGSNNLNNNEININRSMTSQNGGTSVTDGGSILALANNCTISSSGTCTDQATILTLTQNFTGATGQVEVINNSGTQAGLDVEETPTYTTGTYNITSTLFNVTRAPIVSGAALTNNGNLLNITNACTVTVGTCSDSATILTLNQQNSSASGNIIGISNAGSGNDIADGTNWFITSAGAITTSSTSAAAINLTGTNAGLTFANGGSINTASGNITINSSSATGIIHIGTGLGTSTPSLLALDVKSTSGDPATSLVNGEMYFNANSNVFRCYTTAWGNCFTAPTTAWSSITNATANLSLNMNAYTSTFSYATNSGDSGNVFAVSDSTAGTSGSGSLFSLTTGVFGYPTNGRSIDSGDQNQVVGSKFQTGNDTVTVTSLNVYIGNVDNYPNNKFQMGIYSDNAGAPGTLITNSSDGYLVPNSWNRVAVSTTLNPKTYYWIFYNTNSSSSTLNNPFFDTFGSNTSAWSPGGVTYGTWPGTFTYTFINATFSMYASTSTNLNPLSVTNSTTTALSVKSTGNVGIGTNAPSTNLSIVGNTANVANASYPPVKVSTTTLNGTTPQPQDIAVVGKYAYITIKNNNVMEIYDVSNPATPGYISSIATGTSPVTVVVKGRYAYVINAVGASSYGSLQIIDISNPHTPSTISTTSVSSSYEAWGLAVVGTYAYVTTTGTGTDGLYIYNISNPVTPTLTGSYSGANVASSRDVVIQGNYAYIANSSASTGGLTIFDVSNPASPTYKSTYALNNSWDVAVQGRYAYVTDSNDSGVGNSVMLDVKDPTVTPVLVATNNTGTGTYRNDYYIAISGRYALITNYSASTTYAYIYVIDLSTSTTFTTLMDTYSTDLNQPKAIAFDGRYGYEVNGSGTLHILDVSGMETTSVLAHSLEAGTVNVDTNAIIANNLIVGTGLNVGQGGIYSNGDIAGSGAFGQTYSALTGNATSMSLTGLATTTNGLSISQAPSYTATLGNTGNLANLSRNPTISSGTLTDSGALISLTDNCSGAGTCTDTSNLALFTESYASASGSVINIASNAGTGFDISGTNWSVTKAGIITSSLAGNTVLALTGSGAGITFTNTSTTGGFVTSAGTLTIQPAGASTTSTVQIGIGGPTGSATPDLLALDVKSTAGDPAGGVAGDMYYNTSATKFRCFQQSEWTNCIGTGTAPLWSDITNPIANLSSLSMANYTTSFNYTTTGSSNIFTMQDSASGSGTGYLFVSNTPASSVINPFSVTARAALAFKVTNTGIVDMGGTTVTFDTSGNITSSSTIAQTWASTNSTGSSISLTGAATSAKGLSISQTATYTSAQTNSGNLLSLNRNPTISPTYSVTQSGALLSATDNCTGAGACSDASSPLLSLTESYATATGNVINIINNSGGLLGSPYSSIITINNTGNSSTLTNYQVSFTYNTATAITAGQMRSDCGDIRFLDSNNSTAINNYWIEPGTCNTANTKIWVKIPSITASSNYTIYMYYGNAALTTLSSVANTFIDDISNLAQSLNLNDGSGTSVFDSSGYADYATWSGTMGSQWSSSGPYGYSGYFNGTDNMINSHSATPPTTATTNITMESWVYWRSTSSFQQLWYNGSSGSNGYGFYISNGTNSGNGNKLFLLRGGQGAGFGNTGYSLPSNQWVHIVLERGASAWSLYANNVSQTWTDSDSPTAPSTNGTSMSFDGAHLFYGNIANFRIFSAALTPTQISEEYNNYGYTTPNYSGHEVIRAFSSPDPTTSASPYTGNDIADANNNWTIAKNGNIWLAGNKNMLTGLTQGGGGTHFGTLDIGNNGTPGLGFAAGTGNFSGDPSNGTLIAGLLPSSFAGNIIDFQYWTGSAVQKKFAVNNAGYISSAGYFTAGGYSVTSSFGTMDVTDGLGWNGSGGGTGLALNYQSGFTGDLIDLQNNGSKVFIADAGGNLTNAGNKISTNALTIAAPAVTTAVLGTGGTISISGNDTRGTITITNGASGYGSTGAISAIFTFRTAYASAPTIIISPAGTTINTTSQAMSTYNMYVTDTASGFYINLGTAITGGTNTLCRTYSCYINYQVIQ